MFIARHLGRHVPGNPTVIVQNMPGAGEMLATNWLFNVAPRDGTVWGTVGRNIPNAGFQGRLAPATTPPNSSGSAVRKTRQPGLLRHGEGQGAEGR